MSVFGFYFAKSDEAQKTRSAQGNIEEGENETVPQTTPAKDVSSNQVVAAASSASGDPVDDASIPTTEEHASCPESGGPADAATASPSLEVQQEGSSADSGWRWLPDWQRWGHDTSGMMFDPHSGKYFVLNGTEMQEVEGGEEEKKEEVGEEVIGEWDGESLSGGDSLSEGALEDFDGEGFDEEEDASHLVGLQTDKETVENGAEEEKHNPDVCGDWIWDGEWWITAEGHSYHPVLKQLFHNGERVLSKVPVPLYLLLFFFTLVTGPRRSLSLKLSDTRVYEPQIRASI